MLFVISFCYMFLHIASIYTVGHNLAPVKYYDYSIFLSPVKGPMAIPVMVNH